MKTNKFFLILFSGIALANCTSENDLLNNVEKDNNRIMFESYSGITKGAPIISNGTGVSNTSNNPSWFKYAGRLIRVTGFVDKAGGTENKYMDATIMFSTNIGWVFQNSSEQAYWPTKGEKLNFYAIHPHNDFFDRDQNKHKGKISYVNTQKRMIITDYVVPQDISSQQDLMYSIEHAISKPISGNEVTLHFRHAMNQINFIGKTNSKELFVEIAPNGIDLCNIKQKGTFNVHINALNQITPEWSNTSEPANFTIATKYEADGVTQLPVIINTDEPSPFEFTPPIEITADKNVMMLIPQTVIAWNPQSLVQASKQKTNAYLKIRCKIWMKNSGDPVYLHGDASNYEEIFVPFEGKHMNETNKKIIYTLNFGGGYTDEGKPILTPIRFETHIYDWVAETVIR
ncbi:MAG: fimbrillin family protein [Bacteroidales bacterium]